MKILKKFNHLLQNTIKMKILLWISAVKIVIDGIHQGQASDDNNFKLVKLN